MNVISVVTATIQAGDALEKTLRSVASQSYSRVEHIVVDGTPDGSARPLAEKYGSGYIRRERHGVYDALNAGLEKCTGDILGLLHGADIFASDDILDRVAQAFDSDPELDFVYADIRYVSPGTYSPGRLYRADRFRPAHLLYGMAPPHPTLYMRRRVLEKVGYYDTGYVMCGDTDMWMRLFADTSLHSRYLPLTMVLMPTGGLSTTLRARLFTNNMEKLKALRANGLPANPLNLAGKYLLILRDLLSGRRP